MKVLKIRLLLDVRTKIFNKFKRTDKPSTPPMPKKVTAVRVFVPQDKSHLDENYLKTDQ